MKNQSKKVKVCSSILTLDNGIPKAYAKKTQEKDNLKIQKKFYKNAEIIDQNDRTKI